MLFRSRRPAWNTVELMPRIHPKLFQRFYETEALGGLVLLFCGLAALAVANSPWASGYHALWTIPFSIGHRDHLLSLTLHQWINDGLMSIFFLLVGLEIKRELLAGELAMPRQAVLPIAGAIGGMVVPAALYWALNMTGPEASGWGVPMATDIAFALGALSLIAPRAPIGGKVFLTALAIVDDMGAVFVIALFYSSAIVPSALAGAALITLILVVLNVCGVRKLWPYLLLGIVLWVFVHESGVHATIAAVVLAFTIPTRTRINAVEFSREARALLDDFDRTETGDFLVLTSKGQQEALFALERASEAVNAPLLRLEHALHNFSAYVVMPLFAFVNAGVTVGAVRDLSLVGGVMLGLLVGKPFGITAAAYLAVRTGLASLPTGMDWRTLHGFTWLAGIGFTMSLFIAMLAFDDPMLIDSAKVGILAASVAAGIFGATVLRTSTPPTLRDDS
jgi:Na+:H+ antiporter, NhaA family